MLTYRLDSITWVWDLRFCISKMFLDVHATDTETRLWITEKLFLIHLNYNKCLNSDTKWYYLEWIEWLFPKKIWEKRSLITSAKTLFSSKVISCNLDFYYHTLKFTLCYTIMSLDKCILLYIHTYTITQNNSNALKIPLCSSL